MPSTYTLNNGIELIATGEQSGTWGDTTNTNLELLDTSLDGQVTVTLASTGSSGSPNTLPVSDGAASNGRNRLVIFNDSSDLGGTAFVQLTPNDAEKIIYVRNSLSGSRSILLFQGTYNASNDYEVPAGTTAVVFFDGAGSGAVAANVFNNAHFDNLNVVGDASIEGTLTVDTINEFTSAAGVTVEGVVLKDGGATVTADINFGDNDKAIFGAGSDLQIYHDGSNSYISDQGTGHIKILANDFRVVNAANTEQMITADQDGAVTLYNDSVAKLATTSSGIDVTGNILRMDGTAPMMYFMETGVTDSNHRIRQNTGNLYFQKLSDDTNTATTRMAIDGGTGDITFYETDGTTASFVYDADAGTTFNEAGSDRDFRVESDSNTHMLFVDAGSDHVNIGTSSDRGGVLNVYGSGNPIAVIESESDGTVLSLRTTDTDANHGPSLELYRNATGASNDNLGSIIIKGTDASAQDQIYFSIGTQISAAGNGVEASTVYFQNAVAGTVRERITMSSSSLVINQEGLDNDFRVESDGNTHMLFVDAALNRVGIGDSAPTDKLTMSFSTNNSSLIDTGGTTANAAGGIKIINTADTNGNFAGTFYRVGNADAKIAVVKTDSNRSAMRFFIDKGGIQQQLALADGENVFNEGSADQDFRVESNAEANFFVINANDETLSINTNLTSTQEVETGGPNAPMTIKNGLNVFRNLSASGSDRNIINIDSAGSWSSAGNDGTTSNLRWSNGTSNTMGVIGLQFGSTQSGGQSEFVIKDLYQSGFGASGLIAVFGSGKYSKFMGSMTVNEDGLNQDFRVESDSNSIALVVDAGANSVYFGGTPSYNGGNANTGILFEANGSDSQTILTANKTNTNFNISKVSGYTNGNFLNFYVNTAAVGAIYTNGSTTTYSTSSDYRLKENVIDLSGATERLKQLQPKRFNFIADADTTVDGFLAHEVQSVVPEAISGEKDGVDADGNPEYQGIDQSKLVPLLVATIQELEARITALENA